MKPDDPHWLLGFLRQRFRDTVGVRQDLVEELTKPGFKDIYVANTETFNLYRQFDTIVDGT